MEVRRRERRGTRSRNKTGIERMRGNGRRETREQSRRRNKKRRG